MKCSPPLIDVRTRSTTTWRSCPIDGSSSSSSSDGPSLGIVKRTAKVPVVAVIGRPNVGKSTIVNRISKTMSRDPDAIVFDYEGVTRDRIYRR